MGRGKVVVAPEGDRWLVRRRWLDRPLPDLRKRFRQGRDEGLEENVVDGLFSVPDVTEGWASIGLAVAILLIVFVLLPLLGVALELIALIFILFSGLAGKVFFGRPWIVEAVPKDGSGRSVRFPVKGWRRAGQAAVDLSRVIATTGSPEHFQIPDLP
ncbi:MAG TPA: hypothetical protein VJL81_18370 [Solirubrobacterales bacterium]|nr:hypothetical protein [Solirubrobacterales bacterium]